MEKIFERQPYVSYKINIKIEDYSYLINKCKISEITLDNSNPIFYPEIITTL